MPPASSAKSSRRNRSHVNCEPSWNDMRRSVDGLKLSHLRVARIQSRHISTYNTVARMQDIGLWELNRPLISNNLKSGVNSELCLIHLIKSLINLVDTIRFESAKL